MVVSPAPNRLPTVSLILGPPHLQDTPLSLLLVDIITEKTTMVVSPAPNRLPTVSLILGPPHLQDTPLSLLLVERNLILPVPLLFMGHLLLGCPPPVEGLVLGPQSLALNLPHQQPLLNSFIVLNFKTILTLEVIIGKNLE